MKPCPPLLRVLAVASLLWAGCAAAQAEDFKLGNNQYNVPRLNNTMNFAGCHNYQASNGRKICILVPKVRKPDDMCAKNKDASCIDSHVSKFDYWEPSELIEVSCRKGFSLLKGSVGEIPENQSCVGPSRGALAGKAHRWYFDARVWAINGGAGAAREQAAGSTLRKQSVACGGNHPLVRLQGYAKKFDMFSRGGGGGPGNSWEAYISDYDPAWSVDPQGQKARTPPPQQACSGKDVASCWGTLAPFMGWVTHPHQPVAAALAGWRAHYKALGKISPALDGGYKINMDYPYIKRTSPYGASMGVPGGSGTAGWQGSDCFTPGDPGPWWFTANQQQTAPDQLYEKMNQLRVGDVSQGADLFPGVYIFTVWVHTGCELFVGTAGTDVQGAVNDCRDKQFY